MAAVGHDKAGALAVLQQSIVPDLVTETPVTGLHALPNSSSTMLCVITGPSASRDSLLHTMTCGACGLRGG